MSDNVDDYLSDAFLIEPTTSKEPISYAERRKRAQRNSERKNLANRKRSRKELEGTSLQEGLSRSLFQQAQDERGPTATSLSGSKAMNMMLKMGFQIGQSLGKPETASTTAVSDEGNKPTNHRTEPIPIHFWSGKEGLGRKKRAVSNNADPMTQENQQRKQDDFVQHSQKIYEERRSESRLYSAQKTLRTLDDKAGIQDNYLSINPSDRDSFPPGWSAALKANENACVDMGANTTHESRLRKQIKADRLTSVNLGDSDSDGGDGTTPDQVDAVILEPELMEKCIQFFNLSVTERLAEVIGYLRIKYYYCFWCGTQYKDGKELHKLCPGVEENAHD